MEVDSREWLSDLKRRVQHYGYKYDYKARRVDPTMFVGSLPEFALEVADKLVEFGLVSTLPDQLIVNEYQPGQGIYRHVDCEPCFRDEIATVSLGSQYKMDMAEIQGNRSVAISLPVGSCLVFTGKSRYEWTHGIKPRRTDDGHRRGRRVSLTFRRVILTETET
jgi:alkylated DNA repair dioxygenase AlkB